MCLRLGYKHGRVSEQILGRRAQGITLRYFSREWLQKAASLVQTPSLPGSMEEHLFLRVFWGNNKFPHQTEPADSPDLHCLNYRNFTRERFRLKEHNFSHVLLRPCCMVSHDKPPLCLPVSSLKYTSLQGQPSTILFTAILPYLKFCPVHMASSNFFKNR